MAKAVAVSIAKITAVIKKILRKGITSETFFKREIELNQDERGFNGFLLDVGAFAFEVEFFRHIAVTAADGYEYETNGLIVVVAVNKKIFVQRYRLRNFFQT